MLRPYVCHSIVICGYSQLDQPIEWTTTFQVHQQSSLSPVGTPLQVGSSDPLPEAVVTGERLPDSSDSQLCNIENTEKCAHKYPDVIFVRRARVFRNLTA